MTKRERKSLNAIVLAPDTLNFAVIVQSEQLQKGNEIPRSRGFLSRCVVEAARNDKTRRKQIKSIALIIDQAAPAAFAVEEINHKSNLCKMIIGGKIKEGSVMYPQD
jgi:hypothetical protein